MDLHSETHLRALERNTIQGRDQLVLPLYEYLGIDYEDVEEGGLSLHLYGWGRKDLTASDYFDSDGDGELLYGYLEYARPYGSFHARLGRQRIVAGITNEIVDGLGVAYDLGRYLSFSAFGGLPAAYYEENGSGGDHIFGGRVAHHLGQAYQVGIAYQKIVDDAETVAEIAGVDLTADLSRHVSLSGLSAYNVDTNQWREHRYEGELHLGVLTLAPRYHQFNFEDYFTDSPKAGSLFRFLEDTKETLTLFGGDGEVAIGTRLVLGAKATHYHYDQRNEDALYTAGLVTFGRHSALEAGVEAGQMRGDSDDNRYRLYRGYLYWQVGGTLLREAFVSADAQLVDYETDIYGDSQAQFYQLGVGGRLWPDFLTLKISVSYAQDPYYDEDISAILSLILDR